MNNLITLGSLFAFMLIPMWIPLLVIVGGKLVDLVSPRGKDPIAARVVAVKESARGRHAAPLRPQADAA